MTQHKNTRNLQFIFPSLIAQIWLIKAKSEKNSLNDIQVISKFQFESQQPKEKTFCWFFLATILREFFCDLS